MRAGNAASKETITDMDENYASAHLATLGLLVGQPRGEFDGDAGEAPSSSPSSSSSSSSEGSEGSAVKEPRCHRGFRPEGRRGEAPEQPCFGPYPARYHLEPFC
ncbi:hypothetical protein PHYPSEUDO_009934 [Phytophthora pseudosyringae]|uniref:Uncharacterized protein n=1 Tax=Phytophthora pseudosyringae TaxID=221518 RepID=A0A8T1VBV5_9STRA|nr:hypothetical protein PHYPSEUDO_009934 [Phytophthora pseudosyringae]